jgi:hypothetical protein
MSVSASSSATAGSAISRACSSVKPLNTITVKPRSRRARASAAAPVAWASGSPPRNVTPSTPPPSAASSTWRRTSAAVRGVPPSKGSISGLQQPGQRSGQPWNHSAKRTPGPSASVTGTICATRSTTSSRLGTAAITPPSGR